MAKAFWITDSRFKFIAILLMIIWLGFMVLFFLKAEEITNNPCNVCAKRMDMPVKFALEGKQRSYNPDGTMEEFVFNYGVAPKLNNSWSG